MPDGTTMSRSSRCLAGLSRPSSASTCIRPSRRRRTFDGLPAERLPGQKGRGISTMDSRSPGPEAEDQVEVAVLIEVFEGRAAPGRPRCWSGRTARSRIHGGGVEHVGRQNGHGTLPWLRGLILFEGLRGLMSICTVETSGEVTTLRLPPQSGSWPTLQPPT